MDASFMDFEIISAMLPLAMKLFVVLDPPGNIGPIAALIRPFDIKTQNRILRRESFFALITMFLFYTGGSYFLEALDLSTITLKITGGIVFMFLGISILFKKHHGELNQVAVQEPFLVPIATPLIVGPASLTILISYSHSSVNQITAIGAIVIAWVCTASIILLAPFLARKLGRAGLKAAEQIIGVVCVLIATQMILNGIQLFLLA